MYPTDTAGIGEKSNKVNRMRRDYRENLAYLAGLFDGEGTISLGRGGSTMSLRVAVEMTERAPIEDFANAFGGIVHELSKRDSARYAIYRWDLVGAKAKPPLEALEPYLRVKKHQAQVGLEFLRWRGEGHSGVQSTPEQQAKLEYYHSLLKTLKIPGKVLTREGEGNAG